MTQFDYCLPKKEPLKRIFYNVAKYRKETCALMGFSLLLSDVVFFLSLFPQTKFVVDEYWQQKLLLPNQKRPTQKYISKCNQIPKRKLRTDGLFPFIVCCCCFARRRVERRLFLHGGIAQITVLLWKTFLNYNCPNC